MDRVEAAEEFFDSIPENVAYPEETSITFEDVISAAVDAILGWFEEMLKKAATILIEIAKAIVEAIQKLAAALLSGWRRRLSGGSLLGPNERLPSFLE